MLGCLPDRSSSQRWSMVASEAADRLPNAITSTKAVIGNSMVTAAMFSYDRRCVSLQIASSVSMPPAAITAARCSSSGAMPDCAAMGR